MDLLDFDGCSEIWVKSWDDWERFSSVRFACQSQSQTNTEQSPEYARLLAPDCDLFMAMPIKVMAGRGNLKLMR